MSSLGIWMNGHYVGAWRQARGGRDELTYDKAWRDSPQARALSLSLPITASGVITSPTVRHYFDNLLPDNPQIRERLMRRFGTRSDDTFDLLEALGRECAGAVQLLPPGVEPGGWDRIDAEPLSAKDVAAILRAVPTAAAPELEGGADLRLSIAGNQEKTALLRFGRKWHRPRGATPTTHLLKLPLGIVGGLKLDLRDSVDNEWLCAALLDELGLPVAPASIGRFGDQRALVVERFDRRWQSIGDADPDSSGFRPPKAAWIARLPQEDFCQATGRAQTQKYEADGGAGIAEILAILATAEQPAEDRRRFLLAQLAFWLLAAIDGHAKNFSIFHLRGGRHALTPLYDVLSAWPVIGPRSGQLARQKVKLAMAVRGTSGAHYKLLEIQPRHWQALADTVPEANAWPAMLALAGEVQSAIDRVERMLPKDFAEPVWTAVTGGMRKQASAFLKGAQKPG